MFRLVREDLQVAAIMGGATSVNTVATISIYNWNNESLIAGGALTINVASAAFGSDTISGRTAGGTLSAGNTTGVNNVQRYRFQTFTAFAGTVMSSTKYNGFGHSNRTHFIVSGGSAGVTVQGSTAVITCTTDAVSTGNSLVTGKYQVVPAIGNSTFLVVGGGSSTFGGSGVNTTFTINMSNFAVGTGGNLDVIKQWMGSVGNTTTGLYLNGTIGTFNFANASSTSSKYTYSTATAVSGMALTQTRASGFGTSNATHGYFGGGAANGTVSFLASMQKLNFSTSTVTTGTSLPAALQKAQAVSSTPGQLIAP